MVLRFGFRHRICFLGTGRNSHIRGPLSIRIRLQRDRLVTIATLLDIHRDASRLVTFSAPLLFDMQRRGNHLNHRMRVWIAVACIIHAIGCV